ncbi:LOW QUALITY PROTEIN: uncharacterized protein slc10a1 [Symphorus nematophorus]
MPVGRMWLSALEMEVHLILYSTCCSDMEGTVDSRVNLLYDSDLWQNESFTFNTTAANTSSVHTVTMVPVIDKTINTLLIVTLTIVMVSMGCTMEVSKIKTHIMKPKGVAIAALAQYGVMPLTAFSLAKAFQLSEFTAVVVLICGCCPGGSLSNILALALKGDMNLSIVMTCCSTLLALGMMPLLLYIYCQGFPNLQNAVPYVDILISLVMLLIPCGVGILINYYRPKYAKIIIKVSLTVLMITVLVIGILATIGIGGNILTVLSPPLMAVAALMPLIGYAFGYIISALFKLSQAERRTVAMETGCQNIQLCSTILKIAFQPAMVGPLFLFPFVYGAVQLMEAGVLIVLFRGHQMFTRKKKVYNSVQYVLLQMDSRAAESFSFNTTAANTSFVYPGLMPPIIDKTINTILIVGVIIVMVSLGCTIEMSKIKAFQLSEIAAVVVLLCGCCPGGNLSNILALAMQGDMNLSIVMTCCSTLLALAMMPLLLYIYCQSFPNLPRTVPFLRIVISLFLILIPCSVGFLINYYRPQYTRTLKKVGLPVLMITVVATCILSSIGIGGNILTVLSPPLMAIAALMPLIGYAFGYIISALFKLSQAERRTIAVETGCQNNQLCLTILKIASPSDGRPTVSVPIDLCDSQPDGGGGAHCAAQGSSNVHTHKER